MKNIIALIFLTTVFQFTAVAQYQSDITGNPVMLINYTDVQGSPYLINNWVKGAVRLKDGKVYTDIDLKYELLRDLPQYKSGNDEIFDFAGSVSEFTLTEVGKDGTRMRLFRNGFKPYNANSANAFYEILADGYVKFLKKYSKSLLESREYGGASSKSFKEFYNYFIAFDDNLIAVRKDKKSILENLPKKQAEVEAFIKANNLNFKDDQDIAKLIIYYNSL